MRMPADHLVRDRGRHLVEIEQPGLLGHAGMVDHLQQEVAQLALEVRQIAPRDRIGDLVGLLDGIACDAREILLEVPRTAALGIAQPRHHLEQALDRRLAAAAHSRRLVAGRRAPVGPASARRRARPGSGRARRGTGSRARPRSGRARLRAPVDHPDRARGRSRASTPRSSSPRAGLPAGAALPGVADPAPHGVALALRQAGQGLTVTRQPARSRRGRAGLRSGPDAAGDPADSRAAGTPASGTVRVAEEAPWFRRCAVAQAGAEPGERVLRPVEPALKRVRQPFPDRRRVARRFQQSPGSGRPRAGPSGGAAAAHARAACRGTCGGQRLRQDDAQLGTGTAVRRRPSASAHAGRRHGRSGWCRSRGRPPRSAGSAGRRRAHHDLLVERPQILERAAAAPRSARPGAAPDRPPAGH